MKQIEFTKAICSLLLEMIAQGEHPMGHDWHRSAEEQNRLFKEGKSKCDGYKVLSAHQRSCALDIYFVEDGKLVEPVFGYEYWHDVWTISYGGRPAILWDLGHFEG